VLAKRPIANSAWRPVQLLKGIYQDYAKPYRDRLEAMGVSPRELGFAGEADWPEIALRFTLSHDGVHVAIIGTTNPSNARRNLDAVAKGPLPKEVVQRLQAAFKKAAGTARWAGLT
jgi:aryl-alcohol dehydrogenase-like predicted oxidoreductase